MNIMSFKNTLLIVIIGTFFSFSSVVSGTEKAASCSIQIETSKKKAIMRLKKLLLSWKLNSSNEALKDLKKILKSGKSGIKLGQRYLNKDFLHCSKKKRKWCSFRDLLIDTAKYCSKYKLPLKRKKYPIPPRYEGNLKNLKKICNQIFKFTTSKREKGLPSFRECTEVNLFGGAEGDCTWLKDSILQFRNGGQRFGNGVIEGGEHSGKFAFPQENSARQFGKERNEYSNYIEVDLGPKIRGNTIDRGSNRLVYNYKTGDVFITGDHYNTGVYIGCFKNPKKCSSLDYLKSICAEAKYNCIVDDANIIDDMSDLDWLSD